MAANTLIFASKLWLWGVPLAVVLALALWPLSRALARRRMARFVSAKFIPAALATVDLRFKKLRFAWAALVLALLAVTLARPLTGPRADRAEGQGTDFVIALDVSKSMLVEDVPPSRLAAVKKSLGEWITKQKGDRIGLVLFAGDAFVQAPMTHDHTALNLVLQGAGPASVSKGGTNLPKAIEVASKMLTRSEASSKALVIISDGENLEADAVAAAREARAKDGISIFAIGVGTPHGGKVPFEDYSKFAHLPPEKRRRVEFVQDEYGVEVISRFRPQALRAVAMAGGGDYYDFQPDAMVFDLLREKSLAPLVQSTRHINVRDYYEWFQLPLGLVILLLILEPLMPLARRRAGSAQTGVAVVQPVNYSKRPRAAMPAAAGLVIFIALGSAAAAPIDDAEKLIAAGKLNEAVDFMHEQVNRNDSDPYLLYNYGLTLYRAGRFEEAVGIFGNVTTLAPQNVSLRTMATVQMGNSQYRLSEQLKKLGKLPGAVLSLERAVLYYDAAQKIDSRSDVKRNREVSLQQLEALLLKLGGDLMRGGGEYKLRLALPMLERAAEINPQHQPLADEARRRLVEDLAKQAAQKAVDANKLEAEKKNPQNVFSERAVAVAKYEQALQLDPDNQPIQAAAQEQRNLMSDLLTRTAQEQAAPDLAKEKLIRKEQLALEGVVTKLDQALTLNPDNAAAQSTREEVRTKLATSYTEQGKEMLKDLAMPNRKTGTMLSSATKAAESFTSALKHDPQNSEATQGLQQANEALPGLNAAVARENLEKARSLVKSATKPSPSNLQTASGLLEKAMQNYSAAATMQPERAEYQQGLSDAQELLSSVRNQLATRELTDAATAENSADGEPRPSSSSSSSLQSMNTLRNTKRGGDGEKASNRILGEKIRDW